MTKKRLFSAIISILMVFVFAGCSSSADSGQNSAPANGNGNGNGNRPAFQAPDVYGEVSAISGNNVTLKLLKVPQMNRGNRGNGNWSGNRNGNGNGSGSGNGNFNGGNGQRRGGGFMRQRQYTGEVKTITVSSGVPMTTTTFGQNGPTQTNITMSDVSVGDVFSIYYNSGQKTIKNIRVQKPRTGNGGQGGNGGSQNSGGSTGSSGNGA